MNNQAKILEKIMDDFDREKFIKLLDENSSKQIVNEKLFLLAIEILSEAKNINGYTSCKRAGEKNPKSLVKFYAKQAKKDIDKLLRNVENLDNFPDENEVKRVGDFVKGLQIVSDFIKEFDDGIRQANNRLKFKRAKAQ